MADLQIVTVGASSEPTVEETAARLAAEAATAVTTEEEAKAKIAAEEAAKNAPKADPERPTWLPEKFRSAEDMATAYAALEAKIGAPKEEPAADADKAKEGEEKPEEKKDGAEEPKKASEVVASLNDRFSANGKLSDEDYELAESIGHDRATVDAFIAGQTALAELATQRITTAAGGKDSMERLFAWASTSLSADEIGTFNSSFANSDVNAAVIAMEQLKSKYETANGKDPKLVGGKPAGQDSDVFTSWAEVTAAMSDDRYAADHAYRKRVEQKLGRSNVR